MCLVLAYVSSDPFVCAKCLNTLDQCECCEALSYQRSGHLLHIEELMVLGALLSSIITDLCPS
jgi:hypothetical protein